MPDVGYVQMWSLSNGLGKLANLNVFSEMVDDSEIRRFKDNKNKDASIALFSKYQRDWLQNVKYDGYDGDDDALSQKYNVMVVLREVKQVIAVFT